MSTSDLEASFLATTYCVEGHGERFDLRIGEPHPSFASWLDDEDASSWAIITACNPGGMPTPLQNAARNEALRKSIETLGWRYVPARNHADGGRWPDEPGFCIFDAPESQVCALAAGFGQAAIIVGSNGKASGTLVWIDSGKLRD
ncbi:DUF3293 domain-containing protein [Propionivibrio sp.]|uniref:DUF3293 domain-containing protein n=1 Tax=Propionivibrio sp. TaxID=2212460 RepID=UPI00272E5F64|nr:DUF3293 domain-containing protein [Propionivibrio sp.]